MLTRLTELARRKVVVPLGMCLLVSQVAYFSFGKTIISDKGELYAKADGCRYVYLDVGANIGVHNRFLFESSKYPVKDGAAKLFDIFFPDNRNRSDVCAFAFEPNPSLQPRLQSVAAAYAKMGWRLTIMPFAAWLANTDLKFYHQNYSQFGIDGRKLNISPDRGSSAVRHNLAVGYDLVPAIDLGAWVNEHVHSRIIPPPQHPDDPPAAIVMKMDVEGAEFEVLPKMLYDGALCNITAAFVEWHGYLDPAFCKPHCDSRPALDLLFSRAEEMGCKWKIYGTSETTRYTDEVYGLDGVPLPGEAASGHVECKELIPGDCLGFA